MLRFVLRIGLVSMFALTTHDLGASAGIDPPHQLVFKVKGLT
jgi:hypothetical protein